MTQSNQGKLRDEVKKNYRDRSLSPQTCEADYPGEV